VASGLTDALGVSVKNWQASHVRMTGLSAEPEFSHGSLQDSWRQTLSKIFFLLRKDPKNCVVREKSPTGGGKCVALGLHASYDGMVHH
jgi:hypothetical protein